MNVERGPRHSLIGYHAHFWECSLIKTCQINSSLQFFMVRAMTESVIFLLIKWSIAMTGWLKTAEIEMPYKLTNIINASVLKFNFLGTKLTNDSRSLFQEVDNYHNWQIFLENYLSRINENTCWQYVFIWLRKTAQTRKFSYV